MTQTSIDFVTIIQDGRNLAYHRIHDKTHPSLYFSTSRNPDDVYNWFKHNFGLAEIHFPKIRQNIGQTALELTIEKVPDETDWEEFRKDYLENENPEADEDEIEQAYDDCLIEFQSDPYYHYHFFDPDRALARAVREQKGKELQKAMEEDIDNNVFEGREESEAIW